MTQNTIMTMPYDAQAEKAVIGSALLDCDAYDKAAAMGLMAGDFYNERHRLIWQSMEYLSARSEPVNDIVLLANELETAGDAELTGGASYLMECATGTLSSMYVDHYAKLIQTAATRRRIIAAASEVVQQAYAASNEDDPGMMIDAAVDMLMEASAESSSGFKRVGTMLPSVLNQIEDGAIPGVMTGFGMLDKIMGGLRPGELSILAGRPGMGKSGFAQCIINNVCKGGKQVALINLEMSSEDTIKRMLAQLGNVPLTTIRRGGDTVSEEEWVSLITAGALISDFDLYMLEKPQVSVSQLRGILRRVKRTNGLDLVVIDYLQLLSSGRRQGGDENRQQEVSYIARSLKVMARELSVPVLALAQLSRGVESRSDKRPMLSDLRESGEIEQAADSVGFIYRDDYYNSDSDRQNVADIIIAKNRNDATGSAPLFFRKEMTEFRSLEVTRETLTY